MSEIQVDGSGPSGHSQSRPTKRQRQEAHTHFPTDGMDDQLLLPQSPIPQPLQRNYPSQTPPLKSSWPREPQSDKNGLGNKPAKGQLDRKRFTIDYIKTNLTLFSPFPAEKSQSEYTANHPLILSFRDLISNRSGLCSLCAFYDCGPIVTTHKLKRCRHREESKDAAPWLDMFRHYQAKGGGQGARCAHCRFPLALCWRTAYREKMDLQYGSELEAQDYHHVWYQEVQCDWVKRIQQFVSGCLAVGGREEDKGVNELGMHILGMMGWEDWKGLDEAGPAHIRNWLEEMDEVEGLRCPRLLKLFWMLAIAA